MFMNVFPTIFKSHLGPLFTHEETKLFFSMTCSQMSNWVLQQQLNTHEHNKPKHKS